MKKLLFAFLNIIGWFSILIWVILTLIVVLQFYFKWQNPSMKSLSDLDLLYYRNATIIFLLIFAIARVAKRRQYNSEFVNRIKKAEKSGNYTEIDPKDVWRDIR